MKFLRGLWKDVRALWDEYWRLYKELVDHSATCIRCQAGQTSREECCSFVYEKVYK